MASAFSARRPISSRFSRVACWSSRWVCRRWLADTALQGGLDFRPGVFFSGLGLIAGLSAGSLRAIGRRSSPPKTRAAARPFQGPSAAQAILPFSAMRGFRLEILVAAEAQPGLGAPADLGSSVKLRVERALQAGTVSR